MKFSLLIAQYNNGKFFKDCFESIMKQTYKDFEIVILDDCSTDNSLQIIREMVKDDSRFKIFENSKNGGCGFTKKRLVELASGEICGFLDPDDALTPNAIEKSIDEYSKNNIVATYSKFMLCDNKLVPLKPHPNSKQVKNSDIQFFNKGNIISHFFTFKKDTYNLTEGINPNFQIAEDMDIILKIYEKGDINFIDENLYNYRIHNTGVSSLKNNLKAKLWFAIVIYEACKRRNIKFNAEEVLSDILGFTQEKQNFMNSKFHKMAFYGYKKIFRK